MWSVTIIVPCKGRLHHLGETIPLMLTQKAVDLKILIVDYGCPDGTADFCESLELPNLRAIRVERDTEFFSLPRARNIGLRLAETEWCINADADVLMPPDYVYRLLNDAVANGWQMCCAAHNGHICSQMAVTKTAWRTVRGFDEAMQGWGNEDGDFYQRVMLAGIPFGHRERCGLSLISHGDEESVRFYAEKDKQKSAAANLKRKDTIGRPINTEGFGEL